MMLCTLSKSELAAYVRGQLSIFFPDGGLLVDIEPYLDETLSKLDYCIRHIFDRYYKKDGENYFNHLHTDQYSMFLYLLSSVIYKHGGNKNLCEKIFYLNKALHGIDAFYSVELPEIFMFCHPLGTVLGHAEYSNFLLVYQNCTVGSNADGFYPHIGEYVALYKGASVIGDCRIGNNCKVSAHSLILNQDVPENSIFIGRPGNFILKTVRQPDPVWSKSFLDYFQGRDEERANRAKISG